MRNKTASRPACERPPGNRVRDWKGRILPLFAVSYPQAVCPFNLDRHAKIVV
jgi:hypothetical protein